jgi:hypothetical protein
VIGWSDRRITGETATAYGDVISAIDNARLPFPPDGPSSPAGEDGQGRGEDAEHGQGEGKPKKRGGRRVHACFKPRKLPAVARL